MHRGTESSVSVLVHLTQSSACIARSSQSVFKVFLKALWAYNDKENGLEIIVA